MRSKEISEQIQSELNKSIFDALIFMEENLDLIKKEGLISIYNLTKEKVNSYHRLADELSDHLWMSNSLDLELLKQFEEFHYRGAGYRVLFIKEKSNLIPDFKGRSFSKTEKGMFSFIDNAKDYDSDFVKDKNIFKFKSNVFGFDVQSALLFFKKHNSLTQKTIDSFVGEEEVICFDHSEPIHLD